MDNINDIEQLDQDISYEIDGIANTNSALSMISNNENVLSNEDYSESNKITIMESTAALLGCDNFQVSNEGVIDIIKTIIASLKKFFAKIWESIIKLAKQVIKYITNGDKEIDDMLKTTSKLSNESINNSTNTITYHIPNFLIPSIDNTDRLAKLKYLTLKLKEIRLSIYGAMKSYMMNAHAELSREDIINTGFTPFKDYFYNTTVNMYDNDYELSVILAEVMDDFNAYSNGFKFIVGYDKNNMHVVMPLNPESSITKIPCTRTNLNIPTNEFYNKHIHTHLQALKDYKNHMLIEEDGLVDVSKLIKDTKNTLSKIGTTYDKNSGNLVVLNKYIKEITTAIPQIVKSLNMCNLIMYSEYKQILKNVYKAETN